MATDVLIKTYDILQQDLNKAKHNLKGLNDNIRRIIGREPSEENSRNDRGGNRKRGYNDSNRRSGQDLDRSRLRELSPPIKVKRSLETKSVFSRLSGPPSRDDDNGGYRPRIYSRVIRELPTREEIVEAQGVDEESRARNRRMFGCLLGTLQKFCQEESRLKVKEDKKAKVERKLEEQQRKEREVLRRERQILFIDRKRQQLEIRKLESKMILMQEFEIWEKAKRDLMYHIKTKKKPSVYYKPKIMDEKTKKILSDCRADLEKEIEKKRNKLNEEILQLDDRYRLRDDEIEFMEGSEEGRKLLQGGDSKYYQRNDNKSEYDEDDCDSSYGTNSADEREISYDNDRKHSRSVVVTVQNNYRSDSHSNNHYNERHNDYESKNRNDSIEKVVKEENDKENPHTTTIDAGNRDKINVNSIKIKTEKNPKDD